MRMAFDDLQSAGECRVVEPIGKLAKPASDRRNDATFPKFASRDKTSRPDRPPHLSPEAEYLSRPDFDSVNRPDRLPEVLHLPGLQGELSRVGPVKEQASRFGYGRPRILERLGLKLARGRRPPITDPSA